MARSSPGGETVGSAGGGCQEDGVREHYPGRCPAAGRENPQGDPAPSHLHRTPKAPEGRRRGGSQRGST
eukprot:9270704-Heterocapsa_arctica.AAC.1